MIKDKFGLLPIAILENHYPNWKIDENEDEILSVNEICSGLNDIWCDMKIKKVEPNFLFKQEFILDITNQIAEKLGGIPTKEFRNPEIWKSFFTEAYHKDDLAHSKSWIFSHLYWNQLQTFRLTTCWFYYNIFNIHHNLQEEWLIYERVNDFLISLSDAGPPIYDGQTFYPDDYVK